MAKNNKEEILNKKLSKFSVDRGAAGGANKLSQYFLDSARGSTLTDFRGTSWGYV